MKKMVFFILYSALIVAGFSKSTHSIMLHSGISVLVAAAYMVASVASAPSGVVENSCNTGSLQCC